MESYLHDRYNLFTPADIMLVISFPTAKHYYFITSRIDSGVLSGY